MTRASPGEALRFAFGTLTVLRVSVTRWDRPTARAGMLCAPVVGFAVGAAAAAAGSAFALLDGGPLLAAVAATAVPAVLTRGLHLDGLADTADGLGSGKPAEDALRIMKASDTGPFGVLALVFVLLAQIAALYELYGDDWRAGAAGTLTAAVAARTALTLTCRSGVPPARPEGLGNAVAGAVPVRAAALATAASVVVLAAATAAVTADPFPAVRCGLSALAGLGAAELLLHRCRTRFGGITGDVLGATAETSATAAVVILALL